MKKPAEVKRVSKKGAPYPKGKRAIGMLSKWAANRVPVEFIDRNSGLRVPGQLAETSSKNLKSFEFFGESGIAVSILPFTWTKVSTETIGESESVFAEVKGGQRFGIRPDLMRRSSQGEIETVRERLAQWHQMGREVHVYLSHAFYSLAFIGKIVRANGAYFIQRQRDKDERCPDVLVVELDNVICRVEAKPVSGVRVFHVPSGCRLWVSEAEISPADLFAQFSLRSTAVH